MSALSHFQSKFDEWISKVKENFPIGATERTAQSILHQENVRCNSGKHSELNTWVRQTLTLTPTCCKKTEKSVFRPSSEKSQKYTDTKNDRRGGGWKSSLQGPKWSIHQPSSPSGFKMKLRKLQTKQRQTNRRNSEINGVQTSPWKHLQFLTWIQMFKLPYFEFLRKNQEQTTMKRLDIHQSYLDFSCRKLSLCSAHHAAVKTSPLSWVLFWLLWKPETNRRWHQRRGLEKDLILHVSSQPGVTNKSTKPRGGHTLVFLLDPAPHSPSHHHHHHHPPLKLEHSSFFSLTPGLRNNLTITYFRQRQKITWFLNFSLCKLCTDTNPHSQPTHQPSTKHQQSPASGDGVEPTAPPPQICLNLMGSVPLPESQTDPQIKKTNGERERPCWERNYGDRRADAEMLRLFQREVMQLSGNRELQVWSVQTLRRSRFFSGSKTTLQSWGVVSWC